MTAPRRSFATSRGARLVGLAVVAIAVLAYAGTSTDWLGLTKAPARYSTIESAVTAGVVDPNVVARLRADGRVSALVEIRSDDLIAAAQAKAPAGDGPDRAAAIVASLKPAYAGRKAATIGRHLADVRVGREYDVLPLSFVEFRSVAGMLAVANEAGVVGIREDLTVSPSLTQSRALIRADVAAAGGSTGAGVSVAVLDTGIDYTRTAFGSCTSPGVPAGCRVSALLELSAAVADGSLDDDGHGTNVAGIVAGVAPGVKILGYDVFSADGLAYSADLAAAINDLVQRAATRRIASLNMSIGTGAVYTAATCPTWDPGFATARAAGILPVVSAGNSAKSTGLSWPACRTASLSVGAVYDANVGSLSWRVGCTDATTAADKITCFSNSSADLDVLAPGSQITAAGSTYGGTSQAAPHAAACAAILAAAVPYATVDDVEKALKTTGKAITDARNGITRRRIDVVAALAAMPDTTAPVAKAPTQSIGVGSVLPVSGGAVTIPVKLVWSATDAGSGVAGYELQQTLDKGATWTAVSLPSATTTSIVRQLDPTGTYGFRVRARDVAGNVGDWATGANVLVAGYQQDHAAIRYSTAWNAGSSSSYWSSADRWIGAAGASATFTVSNARTVAWISYYRNDTTSPHGQARVYLDGVLQTTVDLYKAQAFRVVAWSIALPDLNSHTVKIVVVGTTGRARVDLDAFVVLHQQ